MNDAKAANITSYEIYKMDSKGEKEFAEKLEENDNVILFTKLKKGGFVIDTPYGHYSPDWAVVCRKDGIEQGAVGIYFIVETKAGKQKENLTDGVLDIDDNILKFLKIIVVPNAIVEENKQANGD